MDQAWCVANGNIGFGSPGFAQDGSGGDIRSVVGGLDEVDIVDARRKQKNGKLDMKKGSRAWILKKKDQMERKGRIVKPSSKYTGRKRHPVF